MPAPNLGSLPLHMPPIVSTMVLLKIWHVNFSSYFIHLLPSSDTPIFITFWLWTPCRTYTQRSSTFKLTSHRLWFKWFLISFLCFCSHQGLPIPHCRKYHCHPQEGGQTPLICLLPPRLELGMYCTRLLTVQIQGLEKEPTTFIKSWSRRQLRGPINLSMLWRSLQLRTKRWKAGKWTCRWKSIQQT